MLHLIASIPSPGSGAIHLGRLQLRAYGLMIALGALAAVWLSGRRLEEAHVAKRDDMGAIAMWALPAGVIGARLYHVITDWKSFRGDWLRAFKIWEGGLGIWGGIALGVFVGLWAGRKRGISGPDLLRAATPSLPLAQAIGRWGNWWNQELFGKPTTVPWALEIDADKRPQAFINDKTFHPTFLYESLWNFALCAALLWIDKKYKPRAGKLFAMYVAGYTFARFFLERLRIDPAYKVAGLRVNEWVSAVAFVLAVAYIVFAPNEKAVPALADGDDLLDGDARSTVRTPPRSTARADRGPTPTRSPTTSRSTTCRSTSQQPTSQRSPSRRSTGRATTATRSPSARPGTDQRRRVVWRVGSAVSGSSGHGCRGYRPRSSARTSG